MPARIALIAVLGAAAGLARAESPCLGLPIAEVVITGCEGPADSPLRCGTVEVNAALRSLVDLPPGTNYSPEIVHRGVHRLTATRYFASVEESCAVDASGAWANVRYAVTANHRVGRVRFSGNAALYDSDLQKRLALRPGAIFNPGAPDSEAERKTQEAAVVRRYAKEGFAEAHVRIESVVTGPESVDLEVIVEEGRRSKVGAMDVDFVREVGDEAVGPFGASVVCPSFTPRVLRIATGLDANEAFTERRRREAERVLVAYLRARGVVDPEVSISHAADAERTAVRVRFQRCIIIRVLERDEPAPGRLGYALSSDDAVLSALTYGESGATDLDESELSRVALELYYQRQGYLFASVELDYRVAPGPATTPGVRGVATFLVTTHWPKEIRGLEFTGNLGLTRRELDDVMKTKVYDFFGAGGYLLVDQLFADLDAVRRRLTDAGYYAARYPRAKPAAAQRDLVEVVRTVDGADDLYDYTYLDLHFRLRQPREENVLYVEIALDAGPPSAVGDVSLRIEPERSGGANTDSAELRTKLSVLPGDPFSPTDVAEDLATIEGAFQALGHHDLDTAVVCRAMGPRGELATTCGTDGLSPCDEDHCDYRTVHAAKVDVSYVVQPGPTYFVGEVFVIGVERTSEAMIRSVLPAPGAPLSRLAIDEAGRRLRLLGVFADVQLTLVGLDEKPPRERVAVVAQLQEGQDRFVDLTVGIQTLVTRDEERGVPEVGGAISTSLGAADSLSQGPSSATPLQIPNFLNVWGVAYRDVNFLGNAIELNLPLKYGLALPESLTDGDAWASAFTRYVEVRPTLYEPRLLGTEIGLRTSVFARYDRATRDVDEFETGATAALDIPITRHLRVATTLTGSAIASGDDCDGAICRLPELLERSSPLAPKVDFDVVSTLDYLDNPIHPTRGLALGTRLRYVLSRGTNERGASGDIGNFLLWELTLKAVTNIRRYLIVAAYVRYADSSSFGFDDNLPSRYRYRLGGINGIRGLADNAVRTFNSLGNPNLVQEGGDSLLMGTLEFRLPLFQRDVGGIWLGFFIDWGGLAESIVDFNDESFRLTAGVGLRYLISGIAVRLDVGFNPLRRCEILSGVSDPTCDPGKLESITQTHFGLLYTF